MKRNVGLLRERRTLKGVFSIKVKGQFIDPSYGIRAVWKYTRIYNPQRRLRVLVIKCRAHTSQMYPPCKKCWNRPASAQSSYCHRFFGAQQASGADPTYVRQLEDKKQHTLTL
ncbi:hypothetical protein TNCV_474191 [Trichonephila clavipes]|nr:hypothetical protein TNCV_474191 [Trichonephila clavipes]